MQKHQGQNVQRQPAIGQFEMEVDSYLMAIDCREPKRQRNENN